MPEPSKVTSSPFSTDWSGPASAVGGWFLGKMLTLTVSVSTSPYGSVTVNSNDNILTLPFSTSGALKVGSATVFDGVSSTSSPPTCFQEMVRESSSGSIPSPVNVTKSPDFAMFWTL